MHLVMVATFALLARHQRKFISLAVIMGIFAIILVPMATSGCDITHLGILHPVMLILLMVICYLQSIVPLSIPLPGYLQWLRMVRYALPAIVVLLAYLVGILFGIRPVVVYSFPELMQNLFSGFVLLRLVTLGIIGYYIVNIFRIPHLLTQVDYPRYLIGYSLALGLSALFFIGTTIICTPLMTFAYVLIYTTLNLYLCFRVLESMALTLPQPVIKEVKHEPTPEEMKRAEDDFNKANQQRFRRVEFWMQKHREEWTDNTFNRDRLCLATGYNRHLLRQCLLSQGYNNVHDYLMSYRIDELKRLIGQGQVTTLTECMDAGFGTITTARSVFLKHEHITLDQYLAQHAKHE